MRTMTILWAVSLLLLFCCPAATRGQATEPRPPDWRAKRLPRIEASPDPTRIQVVPLSQGWARVVGAAGAVTDRRARMVAIVNLATADRVAAAVRSDGSFRATLFAPPGSSLQIGASMVRTEDLLPEFQEALRRDGHVIPSDGPHMEMFDGMIGGHSTSSPAIIVAVRRERASAEGERPLVKKVGRDLWLLGSATCSSVEATPGQTLDLDLTLSVVSGPQASGRRVPRRPPVFGLDLHRLFDANGRQRSPVRQPISDVLTPTGLPIETHGEMVAERRPDGRREWYPSGNGLPVQWQAEDPGTWRIEDGRPTITQRLEFEVPADTPPGIYRLELAIEGVGDPGFDPGEPVISPPCLCHLRIADPASPRLNCLLLGSAGTAGARGTVAREDRERFAINTKIVFTPESLIIPRDDAYTKQPRSYPLDPYVPTLSMAHRPAPVIPKPLIDFDFNQSSLTVTVTGPGGETDRLGPAPLVAGQNDLSVLRPDYVLPDRIMAPVPPTYGNPSASDMYHLSGHGAFDYAFTKYGHYQVELDGHIKDFVGIQYEISGTYDIYVARPLDIDVFPEPGTPLEPNIGLVPQVRVLPPVPAQVEIRWRHYPHSDATRVVERILAGRANRFGVFVPAPKEPPVVFQQPGEYVCDVTVRYKERDGTLWMACRRGASVVVTPNSKIVVHGERGVRSPVARWRARWFRAGDGWLMAPPAHPEMPVDPPPDVPPDRKVIRMRGDLGHICQPYEPGDVAWLGHKMSLFPGVTFEDPQGRISELIERRWPAVRQGAGREGLYPHKLKPEDRRAIGEMPYVCMTSTGLPPSLRPEDVDQWGYFYAISWRPGVAVRSLVAEDTQPVGYWFFDDPYAHQFGNGPQGDLPGDVKMNYASGVFRDASSGVTHYGGYASMLVLIDGRDPLGARVLPPFDGLVPGSPPCGPLLQIGGKRYDVFLTFGAVSPGAILEVGDRLCIAGVVWPPVSGHVQGEIVRPSGRRQQYRTRSSSMGVFDYAGPTADEPGVWMVSAEGVCSGKTSVGTISELVPEEKWPRGGGVGLSDTSFPLPVVPKGSEPIAFDVPLGARARPPLPLVIRGRLPEGAAAETVDVLVRLPGQVVDQRALPTVDGTFEYVYDPRELRKRFPNIDTRIEMPRAGLENASAWFDTVTFTFWAGEGDQLRAGMVLLQGEEVHAQATTGRRMPEVPTRQWKEDALSTQVGGRTDAPLPSNPPGDQTTHSQTTHSQTTHSRDTHSRDTHSRDTHSRDTHSSLLALSSTGSVLLAAHPWSGEVVRIDTRTDRLRTVATARTGGQPRSIAISPDGHRIYAALAEGAQVLVLDAATLKEVTRFEVSGEPRAVLPSADGKAVFVADFDGDRVLRLNADTGNVEARSSQINRPACLALSSRREELYAVSFRTGAIAVLDQQCTVLRRLVAPAQLNQCRTVTLGPDGLLYAPQTRSDTVVGGRMFDRSVFPAIAVADPRDSRVSIKYFPDLLVVPPHRPVEVAVDAAAVYLASAGSDDVLAIDRRSGFAKWHAQHVGLEPGALVLDRVAGRLYVLTITGQEIVTLDAGTGAVLARTRFASDSTPPAVARGRYLFGTATDQRITKDQWVSCAACHPDGEEDGRQWDLGSGPLDTRSLRGCLQTTPLHLDAHLDEIQDTYDFARMAMAGQWFAAREAMHDVLGRSNAGLDADLDALAAYIASLSPKQPPATPAQSAALVQQGREIFFSTKTGCVGCHPPPLYTDSGQRGAKGRFRLHDVGTRSMAKTNALRRLDTPSLLGLRRSEPYLHDGRAQTIEEVFTKFNARDAHGRTSHLSKGEIHALAEFVRYLAPPQPSEGQQASHPKRDDSTIQALRYDLGELRREAEGLRRQVETLRDGKPQER